MKEDVTSMSLRRRGDSYRIERTCVLAALRHR